MARIVWDEIGKRFYENGVDHCVLYPMNPDGTYQNGVPWNGITKITEKPSGADANKKWADNINYLTMYGAEEFGATVEAYTYPDEWMACDGIGTLKYNSTGTTFTGIPGAYVGQQPRLGFGLYYRTKVGNDVSSEIAYKHHMVYGARASTSDRGYESINDSPDAIAFSWEITTTPVEIPGMKPSAIITLDERDFAAQADRTKLDALLDKLLGTDGTANGTAPTLIMPDKVAKILYTGSM